jgi:hypothetical protein
MYLLVLVFLFGCSTPATSNERAGSIFAELEQQLEARDTQYHFWTKNGFKFRCRLTNSSDEEVLLQIWQGENIVHAIAMDPHTEEYLFLYGGHYAFQWKKAGATTIDDWIFRGWKLTPKAAFIYNRTLDAWETTNKDFEHETDR